MTLVLTACEAELTKIADWKMRAGEAALGALAGAGTGYALARDKDKVHNDEAAAALVGAALGAGGGLGLSAVIRTLRAGSMAGKEMPAALKAGKEALVAPGELRERVLEAAKVAKKDHGWVAKTPQPANADMTEVNRLEDLLRQHSAANDVASSARSDHGRAANFIRQQIREEADKLIARLPDLVEQKAAAKPMSLKAKASWLRQQEVAINAKVTEDLMNINQRPMLQDRAKAMKDALTALDAIGQQTVGAENKLRDLSAQATRHGDWGRSSASLKRAETDLQAARDAYRAAEKKHGPGAVTETVKDRAHSAYAKKLFGLIG